MNSMLNQVSPVFALISKIKSSGLTLLLFTSIIAPLLQHPEEVCNNVGA